MNPSEYKKLGPGEKIIISAFMEQYLEDEIKRNKEMEKALRV